ncbi:MAG TPA: hypothetical protein VLU99_02595 [Nitrososphaerales archaeon]|nr:hypothetical protein [Nitrososphaerales archaeon]
METNNNTGIVQPPVEPKKSMVGKLWVVVVLLAGLVAGVLLSDLATLPTRNPIFRRFPLFNPDPLIRLHIVLTTVAVALMVSLVIVYLKVYVETKANFALGLVIVLGALLLQTVLSYPLVLGTSGVILVPGILTTLADFLTVAAYTVFLYLSLE